MEIITKIVFIIIMIFFSIIFHEFGHWWYIYSKKKHKMKLKRKGLILEMALPKRLSREQKKNCLLWGVGFGLLPIVSFILLTPYNFFIFALPLYMAGCKDDLHELIKLIEEENANSPRTKIQEKG